MIILNEKKFAPTNDQFINSLFEDGGTCVGYYKVNKKSISLYDHQRNKVGVIANNVLGTATRQDKGFWYSYGTPKIIGKYESYMKEQEEVQAITERFGLPVKH